MKLAADLDIETADARRKWRERGKVPPKWRWPIVQAAIKQGVPLTMNDFGEAA